MSVAGRRLWGYYLLGLLCYLGSLYSMFWALGAILTGAILGASLPRRQALPLTVACWLTGYLIAPPQQTAFETFYYEEAYLGFLDRAYPFDLARICQGLLLSLGVAAAAGAAVSRPLRWAQDRRRILGILLLAMLCLGQLVTRGLIGRGLLSFCHNEPAPKSYAFDGTQVLKQLHLYRRGHNYYEAFGVATDQDMRNYSRDLSGVSLRPPLELWLLAQLPEPDWVPIAFWYITVLVQLAVYFASRGFLPPLESLLGPLLLGAYYTYANSTPFIFIHDLAGGQVAMLGVACYMLYGWPAALPFLGAAAIMREWSGAFLLFAGALAVRRGNKKEAVALAGVLVMVAMVYLEHNYYCRTLLGMHSSVDPRQRLQGSCCFALAALRQGAIYIAGREFILPMLALFSLAGLRIFRREAGYWLLVAPAAVIFFMLFELGNPEAQYYGFSFAPMLIWGGALALGSMTTVPEDPQP